jgi:hypothetical protein
VGGFKLLCDSTYFGTGGGGCYFCVFVKYVFCRMWRIVWLLDEMGAWLSMWWLQLMRHMSKPEISRIFSNIREYSYNAIRLNLCNYGVQKRLI